ncbi:MAG TPA: hypothetical protein VM779_15810 [Thermoanaerobaculia bacterium]|nr:hypothetical protein [Thermoanaerobaculia bacterium]
MKTTRFLVLAAAILAMAACTTTHETDPAAEPVTTINTAEVEQQTHDPFGPPLEIESPIGNQFPSSAAGGAGNTTGSGTNTNLNPPPPAKAEVTIIETPAPMVSSAPEVEIDAEPEVRTTTTTRTMTRKD